jgi:glutamine amidotransferase
MISIVDYGVVNLGSIRNMLHKLGIEAGLASTPQDLARATKIILPGIGHFDNGMRALSERGLVEPLRAKALAERVPLLGICLGMQLLGAASEEGAQPGMGVVPGRCIRFRFPPGSSFKVPHMGWNEIIPQRESALLAGLSTPARFYFTHSFHFVCDEAQDVLATVKHGIEFTACIARGNVMGVQFHPEKSHRFGMALLRNFGALPC